MKASAVTPVRALSCSTVSHAKSSNPRNLSRSARMLWRLPAGDRHTPRLDRMTAHSQATGSAPEGSRGEGLEQVLKKAGLAPRERVRTSGSWPNVRRIPRAQCGVAMQTAYLTVPQVAAELDISMDGVYK